jgi:hypothetical protein
LQRFFAAALDASTTASLIFSDGRNHAPVSAPGPGADLATVKGFVGFWLLPVRQTPGRDGG